MNAEKGREETGGRRESRSKRLKVDHWVVRKIDG